MVFQVPTTDTNVMADFKTKAMVHQDVSIEAKTRTSSHDVIHPGPVTVEGDDKQTKATENPQRDDQEAGVNYFESKSKAAGCRITETDSEDSQANAIDHRGTHATVIENAGAVSDQMEPGKGTRRVESPHHEPSLSTVDTKDCTTDTGKTHTNGGSSLLQEKGKGLKTTRSIPTNMQTENERALTEESSSMEVETTQGNTLQTPHRQFQDGNTDVPKLERGNLPLTPEHSVHCRPEVATRDFQTQTEVESESLAFKGLRAGNDHEDSVGKELSSTATQTESDGGGVGGEKQDSSTQTEAAEMQDESPDTSNEEAEQSSDSPPLSPTVVPEGATSLLFSGSFPIPADPARLAERIRRNRNRMSAAFDDTEYEPYGLPEVVMKGVYI